ncbi:MAG: hypothetical protein M1838_002645 [Thelocarpon superellum]|nr:MAG: hypothetical protein M1838_002645 [Thelocarpon superellum]
MLLRPQIHHSLSVTQNYVKMPVDKHHNNPHAARPLMPTLSATNRAGRPHITPRIAASTNSAVVTTASTTTPPLHRRTHNPDPYSPKAALKDDHPTPVKAFLSSNITPRSSSRKARGDSSSNTPVGTPDGTPTGSRPASVIAPGPHASDAHSGLGIGGLDDGVFRPRGLVPDGVSPTGLGRPESPGPLGPRAREDASPMFFLASNARTASSLSRAPPSKPASPPKSSSFFYASDVHAPPAASPSNPAPATPQHSAQPKFFHVHDPLAPTAAPLAGVQQTPVLSQRSTGVMPGNPAWQSRGHFSSPIGISSPTPPPWKAVVPQTSPRFTRPAPSPTMTASSAGLSLRAQSNRTTVTQRSGNEGSPERASHGRSTSLNSWGSTSSKGDQNPLLQSPAFISEEHQAFPDGPPDEHNPPSLTSPDEKSPLFSGSSVETPAVAEPAPVNDLAVNARRERKVLDLEISNSSLLAINRTLEREMRKQTAELRRFRRLSRSGRLSLASTSRRSSGRVSSFDTDDEGMTLSDVAEDDSEDDSDDSLSPSSEDDSMDDSSLSPGAVAESDARHRAKDEKRLQLDLQQHQQLLVDSQKMNQSLKRCLGWTEELIAEGKKALEYHVRVSEVELGGRVLVRDEVEDVDDHIDDHPAPDDGHEQDYDALHKFPEGDERDERDSGVDLLDTARGR